MFLGLWLAGFNSTAFSPVVTRANEVGSGGCAQGQGTWGIQKTLAMPPRLVVNIRPPFVYYFMSKYIIPKTSNVFTLAHASTAQECTPGLPSLFLELRAAWHQVQGSPLKMGWEWGVVSQKQQECTIK